MGTEVARTDAVERVERGVALLKERVGEDFAEAVDLEEFNIRDTCGCVLGQLYGSAGIMRGSGYGIMPGYDAGCEALGLYAWAITAVDDPSTAAHYGFTSFGGDADWDALQSAWLAALTESRA